MAGSFDLIFFLFTWIRFTVPLLKASCSRRLGMIHIVNRFDTIPLMTDESKVVRDKIAEIDGRIVSLKSVAERFSRDPGFLIPGLLPTDVRYVFITGPSKHQKTWITHEIVAALGDGTPFLGLYALTHQEDTGVVDELGRDVFETVEGVGKAQKTLYVQQENSEY